MIKILIDADMFAYQACSAAEREIDWGGGISTLHSDIEEAKQFFTEKLLYALERTLNKLQFDGDYETIFCLSDSTDNFRKHILPTYKANRAGKRKPLSYYKLLEWMNENYTVKQQPSLEADDCIGILATLKANKGKTVIVSGDKDMKCIPSKFYDFIRDELSDTTLEDANYWHLYQTLIGDATDGYSGCPKIGPISANKLLKEDHSWDTVVKAYQKQGLSEADALTQARVARILRASDYDFNKGCPILWTP